MKPFIIRLNNIWARRRLARVPISDLLLLAPHCLQRRSCNRQILDGLDQCARCGACDLAGLLHLQEVYGVRSVMAAGGRQALQAVKAPGVRGVIAVACEAELFDGIRAAFPKPVLAIPNQRPEGPCRNTRVDLAAVEAVLQRFTRERGGPGGESDIGKK